MSLLESLLAKNVIINEQHNIRNITVEAGAVDAAMSRLSGGRAWDAAEYGITREQAEAQLAAANTPEARAAVIKDLQDRAIRRAGLDVSNGRVNAMFAGRPAWHGLGVVVSKAATSAEAINFAGLNWRVEKLPNSYTWNGQTFESNDSFTIVRADTGAKLGTVGADYKAVQNAEGFEFLDGVLSDFGARYETAGSIYGGKRVWMLAHLPNKRIEVANGDVTESYVMFSNCHDGSGAAWCFPTTVRTECANTLRLANRDRSKGIWIRHTGKVQQKMNQAKEALGLAVAAVDSYRESAEAMVSAKVEVASFANKVLDEVMEVSAAQVEAGAPMLASLIKGTSEERAAAERQFELKIAKRDRTFQDILERYDSERCQPRGSVWAAFNAVTEHADHNKLGKVSKDASLRASRRFESVLTGDADEMKQAAYSVALAAM